MMSLYMFQILLYFVFAAFQKYISSHCGYDQTYAECKSQLKGEQKITALPSEVRGTEIYGIGSMSCP